MSLRHILRGPDLGPNELGKKAGACIMLESSNLTLGILGGPEEFKQGQDRGKFSVRNTILIAVYIEHRRVGATTQGKHPFFPAMRWKRGPPHVGETLVLPLEWRRAGWGTS